METHFGRWWIPAKPELEVMGVLIIDGDDFWLELESDFGSVLQSVDGTPVHGAYPEIHGTVKGTDYSLLYAYQVTSGLTLPLPGYGSSVSSSDWRGNWLVCGAHVNHDVAPKRVLAKISGLQNWTEFCGVKRVLWQQRDRPVVTGRIDIEKQSSVQFDLDSRLFTLEHVIHSESIEWGFNAFSDSTLIISSEEPAELDRWLDKLIVPFTRLIQVCIGTGGHLDVFAIQLETPHSGEEDFFPYHLFPSPSRRVPFGRTSSTKTRHVKIASLKDMMPLGAIANWFKLYGNPDYKRSIDAFIDMRIGARQLANAERCFISVRCIEVLLAGENATAPFSHEAYAEIQDAVRRILAKDGVPDQKQNEVLAAIKRLRQAKLKTKLHEALAQSICLLHEIDDHLIDAIVDAAAEVRNTFAHTGAENQFAKLQVATVVMECAVLMILLQRVGLTAERTIENIRDTTTYRNVQTVLALYSLDLSD